jgi:hypothetical protein
VKRVTAVQLDLLKGKRQRGRRRPAAPEYSLHCLVADVLVRWCTRDWRYSHFPAGEWRHPATAGRLKRMGVTRGWADFQFFHVAGPVCFLELKRRGEVPSDAQKALAFHLIKAGHGFAVVDNFRDALEVLRAWRIVPATVGV